MKVILMLLLLYMIIPASSQAQNYRVSPGDTLESIAIAPDGMTTFRCYAPHASNVRIGGGDLPEQFRTPPMVKLPNGVWEVTVGPVPPGAYRYTFLVDSLSILDPRNPSVSESNENAWSLMYVSGASFMDTRNVPHGSIAEVTYYSQSLGRFRRMHVYTPPGYDSGKGAYPVFYLLHGAWDCDASWSTVGRAGFIIDNLIAEGKAVPMVVVMPAGHTGPFPFARAGRAPTNPDRDEFVEDFEHDIRPTVETRYRVLNDQEHRAIAGLSMGGMQTLNVAIPHLTEFSSIGVFSSGIFELGNPRGNTNAGKSWEEKNLAILDNAKAKEGVKHLWFATGKDDFLVGISHATVDLLKKHGFTVEYHETDGAHTWINWREYLREYVPLLFKK